MEKKLTIRLFDPGMGYLHRVGLAGLYMTLRYFNSKGITFPGAGWELGKDYVTIYWQGNDRELFDALIKTTFGTNNNGLIDFAAHRGLLTGDLERIFLNDALLMTFLQHPQQNKIPKGITKTVQIDLDEKPVVVTYKPFDNSYAHVQAVKDMIDSKGKLKKIIQIKGWLYPGAVKRHEKISASELDETPERFFALLHAPMAAIYFRFAHKGKDGKFDSRRGAAIVLPHISNLDAYAMCYRRYLQTPVVNLYADGLADAGLAALLTLKAEEKINDLGVSGCTVLTMGSLVWSKQQKSRAAVTSLEDIDDKRLDTFDIVCRSLPNKLVIKNPENIIGGQNQQGKTYFVVTSLSRGLIAENVAMGRDWFAGFWELMGSKEHAKLIYYEKGSLNQMLRENVWSFETDKQFVEALHTAIKNRYGALASRTKANERIPFDREFERMRTGLMRCKNAQSLRAELADIFARGGINSPLQKAWQQILQLFTGRDWQRARDLALLALASYSGVGSDEVIDIGSDEVINEGTGE